jgi:hypothetical protein
VSKSEVDSLLAEARAEIHALMASNGPVVALSVDFVAAKRVLGRTDKKLGPFLVGLLQPDRRDGAVL